MKKITEVTRQDILDIIKDGFILCAEEPFYDEELKDYVIDYEVKMWFAGRLDEIGFFSRIYDLENMPSYDRRYKNAKDDISCHLAWNDYQDNYWFLDDERFKLSRNDDDEYLLKFICEMLHPAVRKENSPWKEYLKKFNELLNPDGYEICPVKSMSGRDVYAAQPIDRVEIKRTSETIYSQIKNIGEGSYAKVFKFKDDFLNKTFALKRAKNDLDEKELERFKREFEQMQCLRSPYIVEVYSYNMDNNEYIMEYLDETLEKYISKNNSKLNINQRKNIISQLIKGYDYIHSKEIFHRDVSFKNVLIKEYDDVLVVKISDFGLVKIPESDLTSQNSELKGCLNDPTLKTKGFANYDFLDEIYALTLLFVYIMTGKTNYGSIKEQQIRKFMNNGTNADRTKRYQSLAELHKAAFECLDSLQ